MINVITSAFGDRSLEKKAKKTKKFLDTIPKGTTTTDISEQIFKSPELQATKETIRKGKAILENPPVVEEDSGIEGIHTERVWVPGVGDPNTEGYKPPRYVFRRTYADGSQEILERNEKELLERAKRSGGQFVDPSIRAIYEKEVEIDVQRFGDIRRIITEKEALGTPEPTATPFVNPEPSSYSDSFVQAIIGFNITSPAQSILSLIAPQARRNVGTVNTLEKKMESYAKEKLIQQVREGSMTREQALHEIETMKIVAFEMEETVLRERDTPIVGRAMEAIDDTLVKIEALKIYLDDTAERITALPPTVWQPAQQGTLGLIQRQAPAPGGVSGFPTRRVE